MIQYKTEKQYVWFGEDTSMAATAQAWRFLFFRPFAFIRLYSSNSFGTNRYKKTSADFDSADESTSGVQELEPIMDVLYGCSIPFNTLITWNKPWNEQR